MWFIGRMCEYFAQCFDSTDHEIAFGRIKGKTLS